MEIIILPPGLTVENTRRDRILSMNSTGYSSAIFYVTALLILNPAYLLQPQSDQPPLNLSPPTKILTGVLVFAMVGVGIFPAYLLDLARAAAGALM